MLSRDVLVLHLLRLFFRCGKYLRQARTEILLTTLDARKTRDRSRAIVEHNLNVRAELAGQRGPNSFRLFKHRAENVLGLDLLILISLSEFDSRLNGFLSSKCESVQAHKKS